MAQNGELIRLESVTRVYPMGEEKVHGLAGVDLSVARGEFVVVIGPSGSGKSTLLHLIGGLDLPTTGRVLVEGEDITRADDGALARYRNQKVGFVFQAFHLQPTFSALENVALPLVFARVPRREREQRARILLERVEMGHRLNHRPNQLSGGERQRVATARALVNNPAILLADEPTGNLDSRTGHRIVELLRGLHDERHITLLVVTHDVEIAGHAGRVLHMRDGRITESNEAP